MSTTDYIQRYPHAAVKSGIKFIELLLYSVDGSVESKESKSVKIRWTTYVL